MRRQVRTAVAALTVVVGVAACSSKNDAARSDTSLGAGAAAGTAGGTSAGTIGSPAGTPGMAGDSASGAAGATSTTGATAAPTTGTASSPMTHADSLRADSTRRGTSRTRRP